MCRLLVGLMIGTILCITVTATSSWSAPGDEFRSDLDIWMDQQAKDQKLRKLELRLQDLEIRLQRVEEEQRTRLKNTEEEGARSRSTKDLQEFIRAHPYGEGFWESERVGR